MTGNQIKSRYGGETIDKYVKFIGKFGGISLTFENTYHAIKISHKYGNRFCIEKDDNGMVCWIKTIHFSK